MLRRGFVSLLILLTGIAGLVHAGETVSHEFYEGYCENGELVIIRWDPRLDQYYRPVCIADKFIIEQKEIVSNVPPDKKPAKWPDRPADWSSWVGIWLNDMGMINPYDDVEPYVTASSGRTLIPIRMVTEGMGGTAEWNESTQMVTIRLNDKYMEMTVGKVEAIANGQPVTLDQPPLIWLNRTMVPLRVVVEAFGAQVNWQGDIRRVDIDLPGVECAEGYCVPW